MTQESLVSIDLTDIQSLRFKCKCGASRSFTFGHSFEPPLRCHQCPAEWIQAGDTNFAILEKLFASLADARKIKSEKFSINLVLPPL